jgi:hypothetical protein
MKKQKALASVIFLTTLATPLVTSAQVSSGVSGWGHCNWENVITPVNTTDYEAYHRRKQTFTQIGYVDPGCCRKQLCPGQNQPSGTLKGTVTNGTTHAWSRTGKISFTINFLWQVITGHPWELTGSDSKTETHTSTAESSSPISCGDIGILFQQIVTVDRFERKWEGTNKKEKSTIDTYGIAEKTIRTGQSFDACTGLTSGVDACLETSPHPTPEPPCEVVLN